MKKAVSLLLIVCLAITLLAGCSGNASQPSSEPPAAQETAAPQTDASQGESEPAAKKTMVIGDTTFNSENWEETVDPHRTYNGWACIRYGIGETLVHYTDSMELEPWLAKSWENDGNLTWTITLQDNVTFSSGRKMDAEAVKQCFEHLLENHDRAPGDTKIADMQADGQTLTITTSEPNPALMNYLGDPYGCIIDVDASDFDAGIVAGTGPYVVTDMVTDDHLTLTKNENYWNSTPKIDELTIRTIDLAQITGTETFEVTPELPSGVTSRADSQTVKITVTLKGLVTKEFTVPTASILRKEAPAGMTFADQNVKITVRGRASVMSTLRMEDLTVTADFSRHYDAAAKQVELEVALPANVSAGVIGGPYTVQVSLSETDGGNTES